MYQDQMTCKVKENLGINDRRIPKEYRDGFLEKAVELRTVEQYSPLNSENALQTPG